MRFEIQVDRHGFWTTRASGDVTEAISEVDLRAELPKFCLQYSHRLLIDGAEVARAEPKRAKPTEPRA